MSRTVVTFDGTTLTSSYVVSDWRTNLLGRRFDTVDIAGVDGQRFLGASLQPRTITLTLTVMGTSLADRESAARTLAAALAVNEPKALSASFLPTDCYYMAVPTSDADSERYVNAESFEVSFLVPDPVLYGKEVTVSCVQDPNQQFRYFAYAGNYPTRPTVTYKGTFPGTISSTEGYLSFDARQPDGTTTMLFADDIAGGEHTIVFDCDKRTMTIDGYTTHHNAPCVMPLPGEWATIMPDTTTAQNGYRIRNQTNATDITVTITYRERWL